LSVNGPESKEKRALTWIEHADFRGWICTQCEWSSPLPTLLSDPEAKVAYDRLAEGKFRQHLCQDYAARSQSAAPGSFSFTPRLKKLVAQGFKPKDAVEILLQEVELESRGDQRVMQRARDDGDDFLRRVRLGLL
jgi:hypothetical protein